MEHKLEGDELKFIGVLDESTKPEDLVSIIEAAHRQASGPLLFDLSEINRANSCGILTWLRILKNFDFEYFYTNTPLWLISQFNMIAEFFTSSAKVKSVQAHYYCGDRDSTIVRVLEIGKDVPILESYDDFDLPNVTVDGYEYEPDFDPAEYFAFVSTHFNKFGGAA